MQRTSRYNLANHELFVKEQMIRNITPNGHITEPASYHGHPVSLQTIMETIIFRDSVDVLYNPAVTHRRRRIEWPTQNIELRRLITQASAPTLPPSNIIQKATALLDDEMSLCDVECGSPADDPAMTYYFFTKIRETLAPCSNCYIGVVECKVPYMGFGSNSACEGLPLQLT